MGVKLLRGDEGNAIVLTDNGGILTTCGTTRSAAIVLAASASTVSLLDLQDQIHTTGLFIGHIRLLCEELDKYRAIPIFSDAENECFFPPDQATGILKVAVSTREAYNKPTNNSGNTFFSPRYETQFPKDTVPKECVGEIRSLLRSTLPELANHEIFD